MVYFSLPGIMEFQKMNTWFLELYKNQRELFYQDAVIDNIYGSFPNAIWNGGRNLPNYSLSYTEMKEIIETYAAYGVKVRFTFTNLLIKEEHLKDPYCNQILDLIHLYNGEITIASNILEGYIRSKYPMIPLISSTTKCILSLQQLNEETEKAYRIVVLDFRRNADFNFLEQIKYKEKIELLLNEDCYENCENRLRHYRDISLNILMFDQMPDTEYYCKGKYKNLYDSFHQASTIRVEDLYHRYDQSGFHHVKLRGRSSDCFDVLESYVYYLIKPDYRDSVRLDALQQRICRSF